MPPRNSESPDSHGANLVFYREANRYLKPCSITAPAGLARSPPGGGLTFVGIHGAGWGDAGATSTGRGWLVRVFFLVVVCFKSIILFIYGEIVSTHAAAL